MSLIVQLVLSDEHIDAIARRVAELTGPLNEGPLSVEAAAKTLGISEATLRRRIKSGVVRAFDDLGKLMVSREEIARVSAGRKKAS